MAEGELELGMVELFAKGRGLLYHRKKVKQILDVRD